jgi:hypothetical protein
MKQFRRAPDPSILASVSLTNWSGESERSLKAFESSLMEFRVPHRPDLESAS